MTNEQKAKEFYHKYRELDLAPESAAFNAAIEMAEWKDQQIEDALKFIQTNNIDEPHLIILHLRKMLLKQ